jgi:SHS2 domain-containing protein
MYEYFEHTADVGLRVQAPDLNALFADAGRALFGLMVENLDDVKPERTVHLTVSGGTSPDQLDYLLFDWLSELIREFEAHRTILCGFQVQASDKGISAECRGETLDAARHRLGHEVKAVTYHELKLEQTHQGWQAEAIVDL